jgi:hypothetical protein
VGVRQRPRIRRIAAGAVQLLPEEIARAKTRLHVPGVRARDQLLRSRARGVLAASLFARARACQSCGALVEYEVNGRARRAKTDRLDLAGLLRLWLLLLAHLSVLAALAGIVYTV